MSFTLLASIVTCLVAGNAFPGTDSFVGLDKSNTLQWLLDGGFVLVEKSCSEACQLSQLGIERVIMYEQVADPQPVSKMILDEPTVHQLIQQLEDEGWRWERLPQRKRKGENEAQQFVYSIGSDEKVWRTSSLNAAESYLKCLLQCDSLKEKYAIQHIPHGKPASFYSDLLVGKVDTSERPAILDVDIDIDLEPTRPAISLQADEHEGSGGGAPVWTNC